MDLDEYNLKSIVCEKTLMKENRQNEQILKILS